MLDIAQKYVDQLKIKFLEATYDEKYKYYQSGWSDEYQPTNSTWHAHEFVSLNSHGEIIGYIAYSINRNDYSASNLKIINFTNNKVVFGKDVVQAIKDIFLKYKFRKISYYVYIGNPIERSYDRLTAKYGGKIVGIKEKEDRLQDGEFYDCKIYEILRERFLERME